MAVSQSEAMTAPLALVFYEKLLPGQQLVNRLQDLGYRVNSVAEASGLVEQIEKQMPMLLVAEFPADKPAIHHAISLIKQDPKTAHVAVLAYVSEVNPRLQESARNAGVNLIASEAGLLEQLPQLIDHVLRLD